MKTTRHIFTPTCEAMQFYSVSGECRRNLPQIKSSRPDRDLKGSIFPEQMDSIIPQTTLVPKFMPV